MKATIIGKTNTHNGYLYTIAYDDKNTIGFKACLCLCSEDIEGEVHITRPFKGWCNIIKK